mgnify:CR=1 FL=1
MFYKKTAIPVLCLSLCLCGGIVPKAAALEVVEPVRQGEITPYATYIRSKTCVLSISAGTATVQASVGRQSGVTDHCKVVAYLQEKSGSTWKTVSTWTDESDGLRASVSKSKSVTAGKTYRDRLVRERFGERNDLFLGRNSVRPCKKYQNAKKVLETS